MGNTFYFNWEPALMEWIQAQLGSFGTSFMSICSAFGEEMILIGVMCILYFIYDKETAKYVARRYMVASCGYSFIKNIFCRLRPYFVHDNVKCLKQVDTGHDLYDVSHQGFSFPSGHSAGSMSIWGGAAIKIKKGWFSTIATIIILLVGISRFALGVHYPTDVLAGYGIGLLSIGIFSLMEKFIKNYKIIYLIWLIVFLPGFFFCKTTDFYSSYGMMVGVFAADLFEKRFVNFEKPKNIFIGILRIIGALALYFGLNYLLKLPFSKDFRESATLASYLVRAIRYGLVLFIPMAIYPMCFKPIDKLFSKK